MEVTGGQMLLEPDGHFTPSLDQTTCLLLVQSVHTILSMFLLSSQISLLLGQLMKKITGEVLMINKNLTECLILTVHCIIYHNVMVKYKSRI